MRSAEFAILVRSDLKGQGLGRLLMNKIIACCRSRGTGEVKGLVLASNQAMLGLARRLGFRVDPGPDGDTVVADARLMSADDVANAAEFGTLGGERSGLELRVREG